MGKILIYTQRRENRSGGGILDAFMCTYFNLRCIVSKNDEERGVYRGIYVHIF